MAFFKILYAIGCSFSNSSNIKPPQKAIINIVINERSAGKPNTPIKKTVIILIGTINPRGATIILYP